MIGAVERGESKYGCSVGFGNVQKGSITVEAAIIVPLVILSLSAVIYMGLLLYQRALVQSAVEMVAEAGAAVWDSGSVEIETSRPASDESEKFRLYRRIYDSEKEHRLERIKEYALYLSSKNELVPASGAEAEAVIMDHGVSRKLEVRVDRYYDMPLGKLVKLFGGSDKVIISVKAVSVINDPAEFIRTADLVIDVEKKLEEKFPELKEIGDKTRETLIRMKDSLEKFMD